MPDVAVAVTGLLGLTEDSWRSVVPCVAWKVWFSMGRVGLVWVEVEMVVFSPENVTKAGGTQKVCHNVKM